MKAARYLYGLTLALIASLAQAATVIDTGTPSGFGGGGPILNPNQWAAGLFSIDTTYLITDVYGWIGSDFHGSGSGLTVTIYNNAGGLPGTEIYSARNPSTAPASSQWFGVNQLAWPLPAGDYWVAFEVRAPDDFDSLFMHGGGHGSGPPNPLTVYAFDLGTQWVIANPGDLQFGLQIHGSALAIPLPQSIWLFGSGLLGLLAMTSSKKTAV